MAIYIVNVLLGGDIIDTYEADEESPEDVILDAYLEQTRQDLTVEMRLPIESEEAEDDQCSTTTATARPSGVASPSSITAPTARNRM